MNVLFLCTGNSARSILAEASLNHWGAGRFQAFSAGSQPKGAVHPLTIDVLNELQLPTAGLRSKSWDEFAVDGAPNMDFIFTVCDNAAGESCPVWLGHPVTAHWGVADPAAAEGDDLMKRKAFVRAYRELEARIKLFVSLPIEKLDRASAKQSLDQIGAGRV